MNGYLILVGLGVIFILIISLLGFGFIFWFIKSDLKQKVVGRIDFLFYGWLILLVLSLVLILLTGSIDLINGYISLYR